MSWLKIYVPMEDEKVAAAYIITSSLLMGWFGSFQIMFHQWSLGCSHPVTHTPMTVSLLHAHAMNVSCDQSDLFFKHFATHGKSSCVISCSYLHALSILFICLFSVCFQGSLYYVCPTVSRGRTC